MHETLRTLLTTLAVLLTLGGTAIAQTLVTPGLTQLDSIPCKGTDLFTFPGTAGEYVIIHVVERADHGGVCCGAAFQFDQTVKLNDPTGLQIAVNSSPSSGNSSSHHFRTQVGPMPLILDGDYEIAVHDIQDCGRGDYALFLQKTSNPGNAVPLSSGDSLLGIINTSGDTQTYTFDANVGDRVTLDMLANQGSIQPLLQMFDPLGRAAEYPYDGSIDTVLTQSGTYTVLAFSEIPGSTSVLGTGTYDLNFVNIPAAGTNYCRTSPNSVGAGALISFAGTTSFTANDLTLIASGCPQGVLGLFYFGQNKVEVPFGSGFRCVGTPYFRFTPVKTSALGIAAYPVDYFDPNTKGTALAPGLWNMQYWYRDTGSFNFSDGLELTLVP